MDIVENDNYFYSEGKIIEGGPDIMVNIQNCLSGDNTSDTKVECLEETAKSVYKYYFERLSQIQANKHNARIQSIIRRFLSTLDTNPETYFNSAFDKFKQITPGNYHGVKNVTGGNYTSIISEMLYVDGFPILNQALKESGRTFMEGSTPDNQCFGVFDYPTKFLNGTEECYICGLGLAQIQGQAGCPTACEHVVNVFESLKFYVGLYNSRSPELSKKELQKIVYKWSCACCNYNKMQMNFIDTNQNAIWYVRDKAIKTVLDLSRRNNNSCCNDLHKGISNTREQTTINQMQVICNNLNTNFPINQIFIRGMNKTNKAKSLKLLEFICVISNISINGIQTVFNKVARNFLSKGSISSKNSNPKKNSKVVKTNRQVKPNMDYLRKQYIPRARRGGGEVNEPTYSIEQYIDESNFVDIYNVIVNELNTKIEQELMNIRLLYAAYDYLEQATHNQPIQATTTEPSHVLQPWKNQEAWQNPERHVVMGYGKKTKRTYKKQNKKKQTKTKRNKTKRNKKK
tara:strand:- start:20378 stop:21922 length:1545 start_codon:yes stop_codon:yes gene_type:complete